MKAHGRLFAAGSVFVALSLWSGVASAAFADEAPLRPVIEVDQDDPSVPGRGLGLTPDPEDDLRGRGNGPVLGIGPKQDDPSVPGRGLGLTPDPEGRDLGLKPNPN